MYYLNINLYTFLANIEDADKTDESAEDITAAETEPKPKNATYGGVKYCKTIGKIILASSADKVPLCKICPPVYAVSFQSEIMRCHI